MNFYLLKILLSIVWTVDGGNISRVNATIVFFYSVLRSLSFLCSSYRICNNSVCTVSRFVIPLHALKANSVAKAQIPLVVSRHDDTLSSPCISAQEKVVTCCVTTAWHDTLVTTNATGATRTTRVQGRRHSVVWVGHVHLTFFLEVVPEIDANPEHKRRNLYTRALLLLRRPPCWNKQGATRTTCASLRTHAWRHATSGLNSSIIVYIMLNQGNWTNSELGNDFGSSLNAERLS